MFTRAYLHIGTEKTGSTSIQAFLTQNRGRLRELGFLHPASPGSGHVGLAAYAAPAEQLGDLLPQIGLQRVAGLPGYRRQLVTGLAEEVAAFPAPRGTLLLSNEHLHSRVTEIGELQRLRGLLGRHCREIRVVVYLRRQDRLAVSLASTLYKAGRTEAWQLPESGSGLPRYYDYAALLAGYAAVFGESNCILRLFEPSRFAGGDLIEDFAATTGIPLSPDMKRPARENPSLTRLGMDVMAELNRRVPGGGRAAPAAARGELVASVTNQYAGKAELITRDQARAFYAQFRAGNAALRQRYMPELDRETLFDEDFAEYPEKIAEEPRSFAQGCELAARLWVDRSQVVHRARFQLKRREAILGALRTHLDGLADAMDPQASPDALRLLAASFYELGEYDRALPLARRAVAANPADAAARLVLGRTLLRAGDRQAAVPELQAALRGDAEPESAALDLAEALRWLDRVDEARAVVETAAERHPADKGLQRLRKELTPRDKREPANDRELPAQSSAN